MSKFKLGFRLGCHRKESPGGCKGNTVFHLIKSKGCQRCGGDLFLEQDEYGIYVSCIQCGAIHAEYSKQEVILSNSRLLVKVGEEIKAL